MNTTMSDSLMQTAPARGLGAFDRWLSLWIAGAMIGGTVLGFLWPGLFATLAALEVASVNFVVAVLIWAMVFPMMVGVDFGALRRIGDRPKGLVVTLVVNWLVKPFTMAALGVLFFEYVFAGLIPPDDAQAYLAGLILLGAAPCTAMVFVWSHLTRGDPTYTLVQVSMNDVVMIFAFAPIVALLLGLTDIAVPWETLLLSVGLYVVIPLVAGLFVRSRFVRTGGERAVDAFKERVKPASIIGLIAMVALLFGFQGEVVVERPLCHRLDCRAAADPVLRHLRRRLRRCPSLAHSLRRRGPLRADRHVELLRARRRSRDQPLRHRLGRGAGDRRRRTGRGAGHAVLGRLREPHAALVSGLTDLR